MVIPSAADRVIGEVRAMTMIQSASAAPDVHILWPLRR